MIPFGFMRAAAAGAAEPNVVIVPFACNTSTGNQVISKAGWTKTPGAALVFVCGATSNDGTPSNDALLGVGFTDGTTHNAVGWRWGHGTTNAESRRSGNQSAVVTIPTAAGIDGEATFSSFGSGSVTINWSDAPAAAYRGVAVLIASGAIANKDVDHFDPVNGANSRSLGFEPDFAFLAHLGASTWSDGNDARGGVGAWATGGDEQAAIGFFGDHGDTEEDAGLEVSRTYCSVRAWLGTATGTLQAAGTATGIDFTGASISGDHQTGYLALETTKSAKVVTAPAIPSTGSWEITGIGFKPEAGIVLSTLAAAFDTRYGHNTGVASALTISIGFFDTDTEACIGIQAEDDAATMNTSSIAKNVLMDLRDHAAVASGELTNPVRGVGTLTVAEGDINGGADSGVGWAILFEE